MSLLSGSPALRRSRPLPRTVAATPTAWGCWRAGLLVLWTAGVVPAVYAAPAPLADPLTVMPGIVRDFDLQTSLPKERPPERPPDASNTRWHIPTDVAQLILWGAVIMGVAFALYALRDSLPGVSKRKRLRPRGPSATVLPLDETVERLLESGEDADALARAGRLAEAIHLLLLRSLGELRRRLDVSFSDALTSREILARLALPEAARAALGDLIRRVELTHFGRHPATHQDYSACRASFERLVGALRGAQAIA